MTFIVREPSVVSKRHKEHSDPVTITSLDWSGTTRYAYCSDGRRRMCHFHRFETKAERQELHKKLVEYAILGTEVCFYAAGNNDPDVWFYRVVDAAKVPPKKKEEEVGLFDLPPHIEALGS